MSKKDGSLGAEIYEVNAGKNAAGDIVGYTVHLGTKGYSSTIEMMVGIGVDGAVVKTSIISMSDTPGLGSKVASDAAFLAQAEGKSDEIIGVKDGANAPNEIDVISGATISSRGYINGVNAALQVYDEIKRGAAQ